MTPDPRGSRIVPVALVLTAAGMIATPLAAPGGRLRRLCTGVVVSGLFTSTTARAAQRWGWRRGLGSAATIAAGTALVEKLGTTTGFPFGRYRYTGALRPRLGGVPVVVALAWFAMALPAREAARAALGPRRGRRSRLVVGAAALTAWDVFLDPQMVTEGYWAWQRAGRYRGIPVTNFVGWFATGLVVMAVLEEMLPPETEPDPVLVGTYGAMAAMESVGFAGFFRDRVVALAGTLAMGPVAVLASRRRRWADG